MTVENTANTVTYTGNGATTVWPFAFNIPSESDLYVYVNDVLQIPSTYTATGFDDDAGGSVTYPVSGPPLATTQEIRIARVLPLTQTMDLTNQDGFYPETVEGGMDRLEFQIQQLDTGIDDNSQAIIDMEQALADALAIFETSIDGTATAHFYSTVGAVQLATISIAVSFIFVAGYYNAGDNGGGLYVRAAVEPVHDGKIQSDDGAWWELTVDEEGAVYWKQFGARGDNSVDDAAAIQSSYDTAVAIGAPRCVGPDGVYRTLSQILLNSNADTVFEGVGKDRTIIQPVGDIIVLRAELTNPTYRAYNFAIRDLTIEDSVGATVGGGSIGIQLEWRGGVILERLRIGDRSGGGSFDYGIRLVSNCPSPRFIDVHINKCNGFGIHHAGTGDNSGHNAWIERCSFVANGVPLGGGAMFWKGGLDMTIVGNDFADNRIGIELENCYGVTIEGNHIETSTVQAMKFANFCVCDIVGNLIGASPNSTLEFLQKSQIRDNNFYDSGTISFASSCTDLDIGHNVFALTGALGATPWTVPTLAAGWTASVGVSPPGYRLHADGSLELRGSADNGGGLGTDLFSLNTGYRPAVAVVAPCTSQTGGQSAVLVSPGGGVRPFAAPGGSVCLDGVRFTIA